MKNRKYLSPDFDAGKWEDISAVYKELSDTIFKTKDDIEKWLLYRGELLAALSEERGRRYIAMTCDTLDPEIKKKYDFFIEEIEPKCKPYEFSLKKKFITSRFYKDFQNKRYFVLTRGFNKYVEIYREENIPLEVKDENLKSEYQKIISSQTVRYRDEEKTLTQLSPLLLETDRELRKTVWELISNRRLEDRDKLHEILDRMVELRHRAALNADFSNFRDYMFTALGRFDYTPEDCIMFHSSIEKVVVPFSREIDSRRKERLNIDVLKPWDLAVDPEGRPPLKPFNTVDELYDGCLRIFKQIDSRLAGQFSKLKENNLLDLENRKGKAPGGYLYGLEETRVPFIFMNAVGIHNNVETLLHEAGHAFHTFASQDEPLYDYRQYGAEIAEVASMSMELISMDKLNIFYKNEEDLKRAKREQLEGIVKVLSWIANIDAFQHWLYLNHKNTHKEREEYWVELRKRFGGIADISGYEDINACMWQAQNHIYTVPFYYIEYGIAQLGALQVWKNYLENPKKTLTQYLEGLSTGGARPIPELFEACGIRFDFSEDLISELMDFLRKELFN